MMTQSNLTFIEGHEITEGYKKTEVGVIPVDWELIKLAEIAEVKMCKRVLSAQTKKNDVIPFFKIGTFGGEPDTYISKSLYDEFRAKYSFPEKGDILISAAGTLGKTVIYDGKESYFQDSNIVWLKVDKKKISNEYLYHYYKVIQWAATEGTTIARLYNGIIYDTQILLPPINEQKIVAEALSDTDALISELEKLIEKKQAIKTATMQQLLTGKTRLPEFALREDGTDKGYQDSELGQIPEDWLIEPLENFTSFISYGFTNPMPTTVNGPYMITAKDINGGKIQYKEARQTSIEAFNTLLTSKSKPKKNDVLLTKDGTLGRLALVEDESICINQSVAVLRPNQRIIPIFFKLLLESSYYQEQMLENAGGSTIKHIYITVVNKMFLALPKSLKEQKKISCILLDIEDSIHKLELKLVKVKAIKVAMMQELLTGKTRLV